MVEGETLVSQQLAQKVAVITGGTSGIGEAVTSLMSALGDSLSECA